MLTKYTIFSHLKTPLLCSGNCFVQQCEPPQKERRSMFSHACLWVQRAQCAIPRLEIKEPASSVCHFFIGVIFAQASV